MKKRLFRVFGIVILLALIGVLLLSRHQNNNQPTHPIPVLGTAG